MKNTQPPNWALQFLRWFCKEDYLDEIEGDLLELFHIRTSSSSVQAAKLFFIWNVFRSFRMVNFKNTQRNNWTMNLFANYIKIYFRKFRKESLHYLVNIAGLSIGFAILFFILMYVYDEHHIDDFHSKNDRIYRVIDRSVEQDGIHEYVSTPGALADALKNEFPVIQETAHITNSGSHVISKGENRITDREWAMVTPAIFDILDIEIISGNPKKKSQGSASLVLTENAAQRLFGRIDVVGERVDDSRFGAIEVIAIMKELPRNSSYQFKELYVTDYDQWEGFWQDLAIGWEHRFTTTWVLLNENATPESIYRGKDAFLKKYYEEEAIANHDFYLQPIQNIHLSSSNIEQGGMAVSTVIGSSSKEFVNIVLMMGFLVLLIAALNYINLSSVQSLKRTLEASMRKINGANYYQLIGQLFFETLLTVLIAYLLSILIVALLFPYFLSVSDKDFSITLLFSQHFWAYHLLTIASIWLLSSLLPAIYYAKLKRSLLVLKNAFSGKGDSLRKVLVGIQYSLSIFLIIGSLVIYRQLDYLQTKDLGFDRSQLIVLDINSGTARSNFKNIIDGIKQNSNIINASTSSRVPGEWKNIPTARVSNTLTGLPITVSHYAIDQYWLATYDMELSAGQNFSGKDQLDSLNILVNKQFVKALSLENPIGSQVWVGSSRDTIKMKIIGVVEDFHFQSLYEPVGPVLLTSWNNHVRSIDYFTARYDGDPQEAIQHIESVNHQFDPNTPPEINFLDKQWERFYKSEESRGKLILIASIVSIVISAFGLFGLINFTVERKTKEIGIRKVMGASIKQIIQLVLHDYLMLIFIAMMFSVPVAWWVFQKWLTDFAYRIDLSLDIIVIAFVIVLLISFTTVLSRIFKIARANPVVAIKYE